MASRAWKKSEILERPLVVATVCRQRCQVQVDLGALGRESVRETKYLQSFGRSIHRQEQLTKIDVRSDILRRSGEGAAEQSFSLRGFLFMCPHDAKQIEGVGVAWRLGEHRIKETLRLS